MGKIFGANMWNSRICSCLTKSHLKSNKFSQITLLMSWTAMIDFFDQFWKQMAFGVLQFVKENQICIYDRTALLTRRKHIQFEAQRTTCAVLRIQWGGYWCHGGSNTYKTVLIYFIRYSNHKVRLLMSKISPMTARNLPSLRNKVFFVEFVDDVHVTLVFEIAVLYAILCFNWPRYTEGRRYSKNTYPTWQFNLFDTMYIEKFHWGRISRREGSPNLVKK